VPIGRQSRRHFVRIQKSAIVSAFRISGFGPLAHGLLLAEELLAMNVKPRIGTYRTQRESAAIFRRYAAKLQAIAAWDREYYSNPSPSLLERAEYHQRKAVLERVRLHLYAELGRVRERAGRLPSSLPN
jgi:hypothetical protein